MLARRFSKAWARAALVLVMSAAAGSILLLVVTARPVVGQGRERSVGQPADQPIDRPVDRPVDSPMDPPVDQPIDQPTGLPHTADPPTDPPGLPSTVQPGTPMRPTAAPPTAQPPPATRPPVSTRPPVPTRTRVSGGGGGEGSGVGDSDNGEGPPPPTPTLEGGLGAPATRTRRPTRTPRTTPTPTPTPMVAGGMRLTLSADPPVLVVGRPATLRVTLGNRQERAAGNVTLQAVVPNDLIVDRYEASLGHTAREGGIVRWFVPTLPTGEQAELSLFGVLGIQRPGGITLCVSVLSAGAPVEHCALFQTTMPAVAAAPPTATPTPEFSDEAAGAEGALSRSTIGWVLLIAGMIAVGLMIGDRLRRRS